MGAVGTWENRMAIRAGIRRRAAEPAEHAAADAEWRASLAAVEREAWARVAGMTLGEALDLLQAEREHGPIWCACIGPPLCCRYAYDQAKMLVRAAHIVVKLIDDAGRR